MIDNRETVRASPQDERRLLLEGLLARKHYRVSFQQQRLWLLDQLEPGRSSYNMPSAIRLRGDLDFVALENTISEVLRRHQALRTRFELLDGQPIQVVEAVRPFELPVTDLTDMQYEEREQTAVRMSREEASRPFDLSRGPLVRAQLLRLGSQEHILLFTLHHIISDGWSVGILVREVSALYQAFTSGLPSPLPELKIQYTDYSVWQRSWLQGDVLQGQLSYWREQLANLPSLELPTDYPRPAIQSYVGGSASGSLLPGLTADLKRLSQREGVTLFMTLLSAFSILLSKYSGEEDIAVGSPIAHRTGGQTEDIIGFFVNTLVHRVDLSGDPTFRQVLGRVRETCLGAFSHQDVPFELLVEKVAPERDLSRNPLFQVMFQYVNVPTAALKLGGLSAEYLETGTQAAKFDLEVNVIDAGDGLQVIAKYATALFRHDTVVRLLNHLIHLLAEAVSDANRRVSSLPLLSEAECRQILVDFNDTRRDYSLSLSVHEQFEAQVALTPDAIAVIFGDEMISYSSLNARSNQLAHFLQSLGVGPDVLVGVCVERSVDMVAALLGVLKAGGAYVPLDPMYPSDRLTFLLEDAKPQVLITQQMLLPDLPPGDYRVICLDRDSGVVALHSTENTYSDACSDHLAYVIYTSGSTGKPKGVQIPRAALLNFLAAMRERPQINPRDILLSVTSISFDIAALEIFLPLTSGARIVLADYQTAHNPESLGALIHKFGVSVMQATPATWRLLVESHWTWPANGLKVLCGGEALSSELAKSLLQSNPVIWNMYGPTETTIWSSLECVETTETLPTIGRPIANTQMYILTSAMNPTPIGVVGDLYIAGAGLARGYLNRPALTAENFVPNPFSDVQGARMYRTGDRARFRADGRIDFLGRADHQIKLRGFRIELGEIEETLAQHPQVREAVVLARKDDQAYDERLIAYIVPKSHHGSSALIDEINGKPSLYDAETRPNGAVRGSQEKWTDALGSRLRTFLKDRLPHYMVPSSFAFLETLPLTPNGKLDRKALPMPTADRAALGSDYIAPSTGLERTLAAIWQDVLGVERVGIHDSFFDLGGTSLKLLRLFSLLEEGFPGKVRVAQLFNHRTIAMQAMLVGARSFDSSDEVIEIEF